MNRTLPDVALPRQLSRVTAGEGAIRNGDTFQSEVGFGHGAEER
jgi:hypothetical protein